MGVQYQAHSCCSENRRCGLSFPEFGFPQCFEKHTPGTRNIQCDDLQLTVTEWAFGCCRSDGTCGVFDPWFELGCLQLPFTEITTCR